MAVAQFTREYRTVRRAEGWGSTQGAYYRALPYRDLTGRYADVWRIRARSFDTFLIAVLAPLEARTTNKLMVLDLGAGSGWLAYRLTARGHRVVAIDLQDDPLDGLAARRHYGVHFDAVLARFEALPLAASHTDLVVYNASLHYASDYVATLREALRVLRPEGTLVILDTPMYHDPSSGARMVREREARFLQTYGFASNALASEHFLTTVRLAELADDLGVRWRIHEPQLDWRDRLKRRVNGLRARREPAHFVIIEGRRA